jgi:hypothetical protein
MQIASVKKLRLYATLFLVLVLATSFSRTPEVNAEFSAEVNQLLVFFRDVLMIDTSQCTVNVNPEHGDNNPALGTRGQKGGKLSLTFNSGGTVDSLFEFRGKFLTWCLIYYDQNNKNPIPYIQAPSGNHLEMARGFLERYETFTNDSTIGEMSDLLTTVNETKRLSLTAGSLKMAIAEAAAPDFSWSYTFEGQDYRLLRIGFFDPPHIFTLGDQRYKYNMDTSAFPKYEPATSILKPEPAISSIDSTINPDFLPVALAATVIVSVGFVAGCIRMNRWAVHFGWKSMRRSTRTSTFDDDSSKKIRRESFG